MVLVMIMMMMVMEVYTDSASCVPVLSLLLSTLTI